MNVVIFGATGSVGRHLVRKALAAGHQVTAFSRKVDVGLPAHEKIRLVRGDVSNLDEVAAAIEGQDAVFCVFGAGRKGVVRAEGTKNIISGMKRHGVRRLVCQTTLGAGESEQNLNFFWRYVMFGLLLRPALEDHARQEEHVRASDLDWTIVRPGGFTDGAETGLYKHGFPATERDLKLKISRADVARFMLDQLGDPTYLHATPGLSY